MSKKTECLQCDGEGGKWTPTWSSDLPNAEVKPVWSKCQYCDGTGWLDEEREELGPDVHQASESSALVSELDHAGFAVRPCNEETVASLCTELGLPHDYRSFLSNVGIVTGTDGYDMLSPDDVRRAVKAQHDFYEHGTFGDSAEDQQALQAETAFRRRLVPFQSAGTRGDFYCYLMSDGRPPIILDVYHDDFELAGAGFDGASTPYTTDLSQHLRWVLGVITDDSSYPP